MKVLKNNYSNENIVNDNVEPYPRKHICEQCGSELEYEESDLRMGEFGAMFIDCPLCGRDNMLEENENSIILTKDNVIFPTHFHYTSKETGAVECCNNSEIRECIEKAINYFRKNKNEFAWFTQYGNLFIVVFNYSRDESYEVTVTNNFYSTTIPFESEDYKKVLP